MGSKERPEAKQSGALASLNPRGKGVVGDLHFVEMSKDWSKGFLVVVALPFEEDGANNFRHYDVYEKLKRSLNTRSAPAQFTNQMQMNDLQKRKTRMIYWHETRVLEEHASQSASFWSRSSAGSEDPFPKVTPYRATQACRWFGLLSADRHVWVHLGLSFNVRLCPPRPAFMSALECISDLAKSRTTITLLPSTTRGLSHFFFYFFSLCLIEFSPPRPLEAWLRDTKQKTAIRFVLCRLYLHWVSDECGKWRVLRPAFLPFYRPKKGMRFERCVGSYFSDILLNLNPNHVQAFLQADHFLGRRYTLVSLFSPEISCWYLDCRRTNHGCVSNDAWSTLCYVLSWKCLVCPLERRDSASTIVWWNEAQGPQVGARYVIIRSYIRFTLQSTWKKLHFRRSCRLSTKWCAKRTRKIHSLTTRILWTIRHISLPMVSLLNLYLF